MAGVLRISLRGLAGGNRTTVCLQQKCGISSKSMRGARKLVKPPPYPYKQKGYGFLNALFDSTQSRFDENTKVIVVDGPLASGKSALAKALADELEMHYVADVTMDKMYINSYGYDMRKRDAELPPMARTFDEKDFCRDPKHRLVANFQIEKYMLRFSEYVDALAHLLSTGQGVVVDRSAYSDFVFMEAMFKNNFVSRDARRVYYELKQNTIGELLRPHLAIYLDVPVDKTMENLKKRNHEWEVKSPALTEKFLTDMETSYKQEYLKEISVHAEMLIYDWTHGGDVEVVVEDIERIDFDRFDKYDPKMKDWRIPDKWEWNDVRNRMTNGKQELMCLFNIPSYDVPELVIGAEDYKEQFEAWENAPGNKFAPGYNKEMGDTGLLTKSKLTL